MAAMLEPVAGEPGVSVPASLGHDPAALRGDAHAFAARIDGSADAIAAAMAEHGFAVVDGACPARLAAACAAELDACAARAPPPPAAARRPLMRPNVTRLGVGADRARAPGAAAFVDVVKPGIAELDFHDARCRDALAGGALDALFDARGAVAAACARALPARLRDELVPLAEPAAVSLKAQRNDGARGGCFPVHYDNAGPPSRRALTCGSSAPSTSAPS